MKVKITSLKNKSKKLSEFRHKQWELIHPEHFGSKQDLFYWTNHKFIFKAEEAGKIIGVIQGYWVAGVMFIDQLVVDSKTQSKGIGTMLMNKVEQIAMQNKLHKIYLQTGIDWQAVGFYEKLGYKKETKITNLWEHKDFWIMSKEL